MTARPIRGADARGPRGARTKMHNPAIAAAVRVRLNSPRRDRGDRRRGRPPGALPAPRRARHLARSERPADRNRTPRRHGGSSARRHPSRPCLLRAVVRRQHRPGAQGRPKHLRVALPRRKRRNGVSARSLRRRGRPSTACSRPFSVRRPLRTCRWPAPRPAHRHGRSNPLRRPSRLAAQARARGVISRARCRKECGQASRLAG
jgi:hypothetical protein